MTRDIEDEAARLAKIIADPVRLQAEAERIADTPVTIALSKCNSLAERLFVLAQLFGTEAAGCFMRYDRNDAKSLREVAAAFDKADMVELAEMARDAASKAKLKEPTWQATNRKARRARQKKFREALGRIKKPA